MKLEDLKPEDDDLKLEEASAIVAVARGAARAKIPIMAYANNFFIVKLLWVWKQDNLNYYRLSIRF